MPRAFCPECAAEVPIDEDGRCFLGHDVPAAAGSSSGRDDVRGAVDEPEPWVASVTGQDTRDDDAVDEASAPAGKVGPMEEARPTTDPGSARASEVPAEDDEVELDLDTLEQAVAEMGLTAEEDEDGAFTVFEEQPSTPEAPTASASEGTEAADPGAPPAEPEVEVHEDAVADVLDVQGVTQAEPETATDQAETTPAEGTGRPAPEDAREDVAREEVARASEPEPTPDPGPAPAAGPEAAAEPAEPEEPAEDEPQEPEEDDGSGSIDTANFLARPKGKRRGLFGR